MADQWEIVRPQQQIPSRSFNEDWKITTPGYEGQGEEGLMSSIFQAPFRVGQDIYNKGLQGIRNIPKYYEKAQTEVPGLFKTAYEHPAHLAMQGLAGSQELINSLAQAPRELTGYIEDRLHLLPKGSKEAVSKFSPEDTSQAISELFGEPKYPGEALTRGAIRNLPQIIGGAGLATYPLSLTKSAIVKNVSKTGKKNLATSQAGYEKLFNEAAQQGNFPQINPSAIDVVGLGGIKNIKRNQPALFETMTNPNVSHQRAQSAISDLGEEIRDLKRTKNINGRLNDKEKRRLSAAQDAKNHIQEQMFGGQRNNLISDLLEKHKGLQTWHAKNVVPYQIPKLQEWRQGRASVSNAYKELLQDPFYTQKASKHRIKQRELLKNALIAAGLGGPGLSLLYDWINKSK